MKDSANNTYITFNNKISYIAVEKDTANSPYINIASESSMLADKSRMIASATPSKFFVVKDKRGTFQFKLYSATGRCVLVGEAYKTKNQAVSAANSVASFVNLAATIDKTIVAEEVH